MSRYEDYKKARATLKNIMNDESSYLTIHYACESFAENKSSSPRIMAIAIDKLSDGQEHVFSLNRSAEKEGINLKACEEDRLDQVELAMLKEYMDFIKINSDKKFLHWSMRSENYGFSAIEHRFEVLNNKLSSTGELSIIHDNNKVDIAELLKARYGSKYSDNPRMYNILNNNDMLPADFLLGKKEINAAENGDYVSIQLSTAGKARSFCKLVKLANDDRLKVKTSWWEIYGISLQGIWEFSKSKWYTAILMNIFSLVIGGIIGAVISKNM